MFSSHLLLRTPFEQQAQRAFFHSPLRLPSAARQRALQTVLSAHVTLCFCLPTIGTSGRRRRIETATEKAALCQNHGQKYGRKKRNPGDIREHKRKQLTENSFNLVLNVKRYKTLSTVCCSRHALLVYGCSAFFAYYFRGFARHSGSVRQAFPRFHYYLIACHFSIIRASVSFHRPSPACASEVPFEKVTSRARPPQQCLPNEINPTRDAKAANFGIMSCDDSGFRGRLDELRDDSAKV